MNKEIAEMIKSELEWSRNQIYDDIEDTGLIDFVHANLGGDRNFIRESPLEPAEIETIDNYSDTLRKFKAMFEALDLEIQKGRGLLDEQRNPGEH
jgi:hypothetical protein